MNQPNRLAHETSPYLLQHANNPVDWHPWGDEAIRLARREQKAIFLSIGYSACHWCHVMEHESFENPEIAGLMNELFVNIKVDREERPDLDQIYMNAVQLMTHRGGWPMSVFLTPDLKPFFGGTYWPPDARMGMPGFRQILRGVHDAWVSRRDEVLSSAEHLVDVIRESADLGDKQSPLTADLLRNAARRLCQSADRTHGGFGGAPKFPHPMDLRVLLRAWKRFSDQESMSVVRLTLDKMAQGGMYDQLGGGFHRYSTDERWLAPHFEKMLYDNALLAVAYLEGWQALGDEADARVAGETLDYVLREMTSPEGGFYSTQDADSEGVEGKFFVWQEAEVREILGPDDAKVFCYCYDVTEHGNWEESNILHRPKPHVQAAQVLGMHPDELSKVLARCREKLFHVRAKRIPPARDDKVLVAWNGLMISAMALGGQILEQWRYVEAARKAADFILHTMRQPDGRLLHSYKDGRARFNGYLDDYACFIDALVELYQASWEANYLGAAVQIAETMLALFWDDKAGGFFYTSHDHEELFARQKDLQDNATPAGNSMAATALLRLARLTGREDFAQRAERTLEVLSPVAAQYPTAAGQTLIAVDFYLGPTFEAVLVEGTNGEENAKALRLVRGRFLPNKVLALKPDGTGEEAIPELLRPLLAGKTARVGAATLYLCEHGTCGLPVSGLVGVEQALERR